MWWNTLPCRHHSGLLASPPPSSKHLSLWCTSSDPASLWLVLMRPDIIHLCPLRVLPLILQSVSNAENLNFMHGCMHRREVTDGKALIYGDIFSCTRSPFLRSSVWCLIADPHRRLHGKYDCSKSLHLNRVWQLGGCRRVKFIGNRPLPLLFISLSLFWLPASKCFEWTHANDNGITGTRARLRVQTENL